MDRAFEASERIHAPHLLDVEVTQVLRRLVQRKEVTVTRAEQALVDLAKLLIERHEHQSLVGRVWHCEIRSAPMTESMWPLRRHWTHRS